MALTFLAPPLLSVQPDVGVRAFGLAAWSLMALSYLPTLIHYRQPAWRSEEHTSELQSLMRISYAVFCLKKKKHHRPRQQQSIHPHLMSPPPPTTDHHPP